MYVNNYERCPASGCTARPKGYSRYCPTHRQRLQQYGHVTARALRPADLRRHAERIRRALADLSEAPAVIAAHAEAERLLNYHAPYGASRPLREIEGRMRHLRAESTVPREVLQAVCEVLFLEHEEHFRDLGSVHCALARQVIKLRTLGSWRPNTLMVRVLGGMLHETLAVFAGGLHRKIDADAEEARKRKEAMAVGWDLPSEFNDDEAE